MAEREEEIVDGERGQIVGRLAVRAATAIEDHDLALRALAVEEDVPRVKVPVYAREPMSEALEPMPMLEHPMLDAPQRLRAGELRSRLAVVAVDDAGDALVMTGEIA